ncbi:NAD(P)-binding domain-containing protein, partial [Variovorax sp. CT11-76]
MSNEPSPASTARERVGFIGLGVMGAPMAGHLARAGHAVSVYDLAQAGAC